MAFSYTTTLSLIEWLCVMGLAQSLLILVYVVFRARSFRQAALAIGYFCLLSAAFALQFALRLEDYADGIHLALWWAWMLGPPMCYLLVVQIARLADLPPPRHFLALLGVPLAAALSFAAEKLFNVCSGRGVLCDRLFDWLYWLGAMTGAGALLALWSSKDVFTALKAAKGGRERYWLALALVAVNVFVVMTALLRSYGKLDVNDTDALLVIFGLAFVYLVTTTLFRVYPLPVQLSDKPRNAPNLTPAEQGLADRIRTLMEVDKMYQEPAFSRADLARELATSEGVLSRVINAAFGKSFPQMLNEFRVNDAKTLLQNPGIPIQTVAAESGFNSLASFNRVFREMTGETPSSFRAGRTNAGQASSA
jgi:AraC-like DNA-binding protein